MAGLIEGGLTAAILLRLQGRAPALVGKGPAPKLLEEEPEPTSGRSRRGLLWAACATLVLALLVPFASSTPDALERVVASLQPR